MSVELDDDDLKRGRTRSPILVLGALDVERHERNAWPHVATPASRMNATPVQVTTKSSVTSPPCASYQYVRLLNYGKEGNMRASLAVLLFFTVAAAEKTLDASCAPPIHPPPLEF
eukprot:scaffold18985_cov39-Phaeocystis_antarctica.AAC.2